MLEDVGLVEFDSRSETDFVLLGHSEGLGRQELFKFSADSREEASLWVHVLRDVQHLTGAMKDSSLSFIGPGRDRASASVVSRFQAGEWTWINGEQAERHSSRWIDQHFSALRTSLTAPLEAG